jgi:predicted phosphoadenosine phosphosulfate sulfurtransferase
MPYGLAKLEPETYNQLEKRLKGVHTAAIFGKENLMYSIKSLSIQYLEEYKEFY